VTADGKPCRNHDPEKQEQRRQWGARRNVSPLPTTPLPSEGQLRTEALQALRSLAVDTNVQDHVRLSAATRLLEVFSPPKPPPGRNGGAAAPPSPSAPEAPLEELLRQ
jgi:hypothetical protein